MRPPRCCRWLMLSWRWRGCPLQQMKAYPSGVCVCVGRGQGCLGALMPNVLGGRRCLRSQASQINTMHNHKHLWLTEAASVSATLWVSHLFGFQRHCYHLHHHLLHVCSSCSCCACSCCRDDERIEYYHLISMKHVGDALDLKILRDGQVCVCDDSDVVLYCRVQRVCQWVCRCVGGMCQCVGGGWLAGNFNSGTSSVRVAWYVCQCWAWGW